MGFEYIVFKDREDAARRLRQALARYKGQNALVLAIPRGAVPMAKIIADGLGGELSAILVHKIPSPESEEFAIGSVGLSGKIHKTPYAERMSIPESYIKMEAQRQLTKLEERYEKYGLVAPNYKNRIVIIVDDGIATGATVIGAIREVLLHKPKRLIVAAAVASKEASEQIRHLADDLVLLEEPEFFYSVSLFFERFDQVTDEEAMAILRAGVAGQVETSL